MLEVEQVKRLRSGLTIKQQMQLAALKKHLGSAAANKPMPKGSESMLGQESKFVQRALKLSSPTPKSFTSKKKGGGMATRGMGAALKKGGMSKGKKYI
jgi:hypothetical protein